MAADRETPPPTHEREDGPAFERQPASPMMGFLGMMMLSCLVGPGALMLMAKARP